MRTNKFALSLAVAGLLTASTALGDDVAVAGDKTGSFVGAYLGTNSVSLKYSATSSVTGVTASGVGAATSGSRLGLVYGSHSGINEKMSYRIYGSADFGDSLYNVAANADFLYGFLNFEKVAIRGFIGAWVGLSVTPQTNPGLAGTTSETTNIIYGVDGGLNVGARVVLFDRHGIELFWRNGFREMESKSKDDFESAYGGTGTLSTTWKLKQSYQTGIRYTFTF